ERHLAAANLARDEALSLYLHLPFCRERCLFCGCNVIVAPRPEQARPYLELLAQEARLVAERLPDRRRVSQLHLGGGTPTYFSPRELTILLDVLLTLFRPLETAEMAVEVDPRVTTSEHVAALAALGFNRMSLGVQDLDPRVQEAIGRRQSPRQTAALVAEARRQGFEGINVDLIYGLPHQSRDGFRRTVEAVTGLGVDRIALYSFGFVPWVHPHQKRIAEEALPAREDKYTLFAEARERILGAGYEAIGMDHFARPGDELAEARRRGRLRRNFQGYTALDVGDVVGLGVSAIGDVAGGYFQNTKKLSVYSEGLGRGRLPTAKGLVRSADDEARRAVIEALMCNFAVDFTAVEQAHDLVFRDAFRDDLDLVAAYESDGLAEVGEARIDVTERGRPFVRNLAMCFDRYRRERRVGEATPTFSRTV
ncbi:MAG: oxygen-independent coproporphyrinogen III oxidase, partial [Thermoanaerobaculia bacterium]|nr:oxygen-independent coproporphyrinogen III oxidase [Thermoanaerobaculia bacterium]